MCTGFEAMAIAQGGSALAGGFAQQQAGAAQGELLGAEAQAQRDQAKAAAGRVRSQTGAAVGQARAALAASGVDVSAGSALDIERDIRTRGAQEAATVLLTGERGARESEFAGQQARAAGRSALTQSVVSAANAGLQSRWRRSTNDRPWWEAPAPIVERGTRYGGE